jgi:plastocyanin
MTYRTVVVATLGAGALALAGGSMASGAGAPSTVKITQTTNIKFVANRYVRDELRWKRDVYQVKSGGTVEVINTAADEGPHTFTVVRKADLPKSFNCKICDKLSQAHGADPESDAPPKFQYLENGVGQATPPNLDRAGDSGVTGEGKKGEHISFKVTAKKGSTLTFMCLIHPWMQAKLEVK